jgi:hypothetical protein
MLLPLAGNIYSRKALSLSVTPFLLLLYPMIEGIWIAFSVNTEI